MGVNVLTVNDVFEDSAELDDAILIERARTDKEAFGALYQRYVERIYNYIYYRTSSVEDAEDLTARTFQRALIHIPNYQDKGVPFQAWLYRIARNLVSNWHRDNGRKPVVALDDVMYTQVGESSPELLMQMIESEDTLMEAIQSMPSERQDLLIYKFLHRLSNAQIGEIMGRSEGAVKSLYHRTLITLREDLTKQTLPDVDMDEDDSAEPKSSRFKRLRFWNRSQDDV